eukprot:759333-Hanusia_phi.AAC.3
MEELILMQAGILTSLSVSEHASAFLRLREVFRGSQPVDSRRTSGSAWELRSARRFQLETEVGLACPRCSPRKTSARSSRTCRASGFFPERQPPAT